MEEKLMIDQEDILVYSNGILHLVISLHQVSIYLKHDPSTWNIS